MTTDIHQIQKNDQDIQSISGLQFTAPELAVILGEDMFNFLLEFGYPQAAARCIAAQHASQSAVYKAVQRGRLLQEAKVRQSIAAMAQAGSNPAQSLFLKLKADRIINEKLRR